MRSKLSLLLIIVLAVLLAACDDASYAPDTFGENGHCYYVQDIGEIDYLREAGLCPRAWTPVIMPVYWHSMYYSYYDSPSYYNKYVPPARRTYYRTVTVTKFEAEHKTEIKKYSSKKTSSSSTKKTTTKSTTSRTTTTRSTSRSR